MTAGVHASVLGFMAAYNGIGFVPCHANPRLLKDYLRDRLGFDGIVAADGLAMDQLEDIASPTPTVGRTTLLAGTGISLWDKGFARFEEYMDDGQVTVVVDTALHRVLKLKAMFGLLPEGDANTATIVMSNTDAIAQATADKREQVKRMAHEVITSINDDQSATTLDDTRNIMTGVQTGPMIAVGPFADNFGRFLDDYTASPPADGQLSVYR